MACFGLFLLVDARFDFLGLIVATVPYYRSLWLIVAHYVLLCLMVACFDSQCLINNFRGSLRLTKAYQDLNSLFLFLSSNSPF